MMMMMTDSILNRFNNIIIIAVFIVNCTPIYTNPHTLSIELIVHFARYYTDGAPITELALTAACWAIEKCKWKLYQRLAITVFEMSRI